MNGEFVKTDGNNEKVRYLRGKGIKGVRVPPSAPLITFLKKIGAFSFLVPS
jgi:hypothetical protein